jgi:hypothetical protein
MTGSPHDETLPQMMTNQLAALPSRSLVVPALVAGGGEVNLDEVERIAIRVTSPLIFFGFSAEQFRCRIPL